MFATVLGVGALGGCAWLARRVLSAGRAPALVGADSPGIPSLGPGSLLRWTALDDLQFARYAGTTR
jgi:hypothetical protein